MVFFVVLMAFMAFVTIMAGFTTVVTLFAMFLAFSLVLLMFSLALFAGGSAGMARSLIRMGALFINSGAVFILADGLGENRGANHSDGQHGHRKTLHKNVPFLNCGYDGCGNTADFLDKGMKGLSKADSEQPAQTMAP